LQGQSRSGTNDENGSGLGLQLCKEFVEKQNGTIDVESSEGKGSTFFVRLPRDDHQHKS
jgi:signal transduction histidine kinase